VTAFEASAHDAYEVARRDDSDGVGLVQYWVLADIDLHQRAVGADEEQLVAGARRLGVNGRPPGKFPTRRTRTPTIDRPARLRRSLWTPTSAERASSETARIASDSSVVVSIPERFRGVKVTRPARANLGIAD